MPTTGLPLTHLSTPRRVLLALVFACLVVCFWANKAEADSISGRVTNKEGEPIGDVVVSLYTFVEDALNPPGYWNSVGIYTYTDTDGEYTLGVPAGTYRLGFVQSFAYREEFFSNSSTIEGATDIVIPDDNSELSDYDAVLGRNGLIVGKVIDRDNHPISGIGVSLLDSNTGEDIGYYGGHGTDEFGEFSVVVPTVDPYVIRINPGIHFVPEYYNNKFDFASAERVVVQGDEVLTITATLSRTKTISGTVTDINGLPVYARIKLYQLSDQDEWSSLADAFVSSYAPRTFSFDGLEPGKYRLGFEYDWIIPEYYNNADEFDQAEIIDLSDSTDTFVANAVVTRRGVITGKVTDQNNAPIEDIAVCRYSEQDGKWTILDCQWTDRQGNYELKGAMPEHDYRIGFEDIGYHTEAPYTSEYFNNVSMIEAAQTLTVPVETTISNINAQLDSYGMITGTVTDLEGHALQSALVQTYRRNTGAPASYAITNAQGRYVVALEPGKEFSIGFAHATHEAEFYNNQPTIAAAMPVTAPLNNVIPNIDAQLSPGPVISGTVTDNSGRVVAGINVTAYDIYENIKASVVTDGNGHYAVGLASGTYRLSFNIADEPDVNGNYIGEYYENSSTLASATAVSLTLGHDLTINDELTIIPSISGQVTDQSGQPTYADIIIYRHVKVNGEWEWQDCGTYACRTTTEYYNPGHYRIANLAPGEYAVSFTPDIWSSYYSEYFLDQPTIDTATIVTVTATSILTNINAAFDVPGKVMGTVVDSQNQPLAGIKVGWYFPEYLTGEYQWPQTTDTDQNGQFAFTIGDGPSWFFFRDPTGRYASEYYDNQFNLETATEITAAHNSTVTIKVELGPSASITGHVANLMGQPLANVHIGVNTYWPQHREKWQPVPGLGATTDVNGDYHLDGLTPGTKYRISFATNDDYYYYPDWAPTGYFLGAAEGNDVVIVGQLLPNIDMVLLQPGEVHADFSGTSHIGTGSLTVNFTDQSQGTVKGRQWDFGDGASSNQANPNHTYEIGVYTVTLTVTGTANSDVERKVSYITVADTPISDLGIEPGNWGGEGETQPVVGQTIFFSATAGGSNVEYLWDFGDGALAATSTASGQYAQHSYAAAGDYTVTLTAHNGVDEEVTTLQVTIQEADNTEPVSALALHGPSTAFVDAMVSLNATAEGDNVSYSWDFGDGESATGQTVQHSYAVAGVYTITLTASNSQGEVEVTSQIIVERGVLLLPRIAR